jgi:lysyl-tRNA synthetase class 2
VACAHIVTRMSGETTERASAPPGVAGAPVAAPAQTSEREALIISERRAKIARLRARGVEPYPHEFTERTQIAQIQAVHDAQSLGEGDHAQLRYRIAGRIVARRGHGRTLFTDLRDGSGWIQVVTRLQAAGEELMRRMDEHDVGDLVGIDGHVYVTPNGQLSLAAEQVTMLAKALRAPAAKHHGLEDVETRYRQRELDLIANAPTRELFVLRARTLAALRDWMNEHGFIEIETPVLQVLAGGANARPFVTHHNALNRDLSLTISGEFHLKRCVVGGLERVYMLDKCFRNEGISHKHSPEFTLLEWEMSYADYHDVHDYMEALIAGVAQRVLGSTVIEQHDGVVLDLTPPWPRVQVRDAILERIGVDIDAARDAGRDAAAREQLTQPLGERVPEHATWGQIVEALYSKLVEPHVVQPTIFYDFPVEFHPVVKRHRERRELIEHFEVVMRGIEVGSGSSELNDPDEQRERFIEQRNRRPLDAGEEPYPADEEFVRAMEYGMPPLGGAGIGVDRLLTIFTGRETLREVIPFPALRDPR